MRKIIRRTVTIVITETWTIVWVDDDATDVAGEAAQSEGTEPALLIEEPTAVDPIVDTEKAALPDAPVAIPLDDAPDISVSGDQKESSNQGKEGGETRVHD